MPTTTPPDSAHLLIVFMIVLSLGVTLIWLSILARVAKALEAIAQSQQDLVAQQERAMQQGYQGKPPPVRRAP